MAQQLRALIALPKVASGASEDNYSVLAYLK